MKTVREMHCRECEHVWEAEAYADELPLVCPECDGTDTFSAIGTGQFALKHNRGDVCGWEMSGYTNTKMIDLRDTPMGSKKERWGKVSN